MFNNLHITPFKKSLTYSLINNLTRETCLTLANMLALDYFARLNFQGIIEEHANICTARLKEFLGLRVITSSDFSTAILLFAVAISPEPTNYHDKKIFNQDKS